ncbi:MAG: Penicillinase repressor [Phycisphaerae bacterium]|nr:Penicillinase repressor [Phycisphaerae bacterium]
MDREDIPGLGPLEHVLMSVLWEIEPATAREVLDRYNAAAERPIAYTTVMTLLTRMAEKGALSVDRSRQPFVFSAAVSRDRMLSRRVRDFVDQFFAGSAADLAVRLVEQQALTDEEVRRLEALIERHRVRSSPGSSPSDAERKGGAS